MNTGFRLEVTGNLLAAARQLARAALPPAERFFEHEYTDVIESHPLVQRANALHQEAFRTFLTEAVRLG